MVVTRTRTLALALAVTLGGSVLAGAPLAPVASAQPSTAAMAGSAPGAIPETVSAHLDGLPTAYGAAAVDAGAEPGDAVSAPAAAPIPFAMVGLELPEGADARLRTSLDGATWGEWLDAPTLEPDDGPDLTAPEGTVEVSRFTEAVWVGAARWLQVSLDGADPAEVDATFIDTLGLSGGATASDGEGVAAAAVGDEALADEALADEALAGSGDGEVAAAARPRIVTRAQWGANEALAKSAPAAPALRYAVIHHTAGSNTYSRAESPAVVRGILHYHTVSLGWSDIGYNILVDRYGTIYEGRRGSLNAAIIGAHAQGFNTGSLGVSVMGDFSSSAPPQAAIDAVADVLAWKLGAARVDPTGGVLITSGGSNKYPAGRQIGMATIFGHRDVGQTTCPGLPFHARLPAIRQMTKDRIAANPPGPGSSFTDVRGVHAASIDTLVKRGVTLGCAPGRFCPSSVVTRAQAVAMLVRARGLNGGGARPFHDVPSSHPHAAAITAGVEAGIVSGVGDGSFRPSAPVTRDQLASMLAKARGLAREPGQFFNDVPWASTHLANINAIGKARISTGCGGGSFCPNRTASRAELATLIVRAFY